jgi:hypothetical protein
MQLDKIGGDCGKDDCPSVFVDSDTDTIVVRGDEISSEEYAQVATTSTERVVRIPKGIFLQAATQLSN